MGKKSKRDAALRKRREDDAAYNRIMKEREEHEKSFAPPPKADSPRTPKAGPVTVTKKGATYVMPSYEDYISSRGWEIRRADYFAGHPRKCQACGSTVQIQLHHKTYARMGRELDSDLVALCQKCHSEVHERHRKQGGNLADVTDQFVKKGWLAQKKNRPARKKGVRSASKAQSRANRKKAERTLSHRNNPTERVVLDNPKRSRSGPVIVKRVGEQESNKGEPDWVKKAENQKRRRR